MCGAGVAGVGKSSIINAIKLQMAAGNGAAANSNEVAAEPEADSAAPSSLLNGNEVQAPAH